MRKTAPLLLSTVVAAALLFGGFSFAGQDPPKGAKSSAGPSASTVPITTVVTVLGPDFAAPPDLTEHDVTVYSGSTREDVVSFVPARGPKAGLQLAILIDDDASPTGLGPHFQEIKGFIEAQAPTTEVGLFYAYAGTVRLAADFSSDHQAVAAKLRLPLGRFAGASPSVYLSLQDLAKRWPASDKRREVLMIASGIDRLHPDPQSPYVDEAIRQVQKSGVVVHTIYTGGFRLAEAAVLQQYAWQNLTQTAGDSGGQKFFQGFETPVNFQPIFHDLNAALGNQYLLTFNVPRSSGKNGERLPIKIRTEQRNIHLSYAPQVFVPGPGS
jgi:hypothetical protein